MLHLLKKVVIINFIISMKYRTIICMQYRGILVFLCLKKNNNIKLALRMYEKNGDHV